jgi:hypothetical protein
VPLSCLYDNPRTITIGRSPQVLWHPRFEDFARYYGYMSRACAGLSRADERQSGDRREVRETQCVLFKRLLADA